MNNSIVIALVVLVLAGAGWLFLAEKDHHDEHDHEHGHEHGEHMLEAKELVREDGVFSIATSFYPLEFALTRIVGDLGEVTNVGEGRDPHDFRPSTEDILTLQQSDLVVLQGAEFEPWGDDVALQLKAERVPVVRATAELELHEAGEHHDEHEDGHGHEHEEEGYMDEDESHEHEDEHHDDEHHHGEHKDEHDHHAHGAFDPHTWLDPVLFSETVMHLTEAVSTLDPENAEAYEANAAALQAELTALHTEYETGLATCAVDEVITSHDAFGYVADRYDITIHSIAGISTQDVPSAQTLAELKEEAEEGVNAILLEESSVTAFGETLGRETGLETFSVNPIAFVIPEGEDYLSLMRANLETFKAALACNG